jgi:hypothetical protein
MPAAQEQEKPAEEKAETPVVQETEKPATEKSETPVVKEPEKPAAEPAKAATVLEPEKVVERVPAIAAAQVAPLRASISPEDLESGYAGGLVGWAQNAEIICGTDEAPITVTLSGTVRGTEAAGGIYGYYYRTAGDWAFDLSAYTLNVTLAGSGSAGGAFGALAATGSVTVTGAEGATYTASFSGGTARGALIGSYSNTALTNTLDIYAVQTSVSGNSDAGSAASGGVIGHITGGAAAYVHITAVAVRNSSGSRVSGGLVGDMGTAGSYVDIDGTVTVRGQYNGGLVGTMTAGVLRLQGTTNLSGSIPMAAARSSITAETV